MEPVNVPTLIDGLGDLEFREIGTFNEGTVGAFWTSGGATSPWEQHPDDDELLQVLEGACEITIMMDDGPVTMALRAGDVIVVPRGHWHRHSSTGPFRELYVTPGRTLHSDAEDPR